MHRLYVRWKPNEVIRPASVGSLCILITLWALLALAIFIAPVSAGNTYEYSFPNNPVPDGQMCVNYDTGSPYFAVFMSNAYVTSMSGLSLTSQPYNWSVGYWSTTQTNATYSLRCMGNGIVGGVPSSMDGFKSYLVVPSNGTHWDARYAAFYYNFTDPSPPVGNTSFYANETSGTTPFLTDMYITTDIKDDANRHIDWNVTGPSMSGFTQLSTLVYRFSAPMAGTYSFNLSIYNATLKSYDYKPNYITVENANTTKKTTCFQAYDGITHGMIMGPSLFIYDQQGNNWSNSSSDSDGLHCIDAYEDHLLDGYATKSGYNQGQQWDVYSTGDIYPINLYPSGMIGIPGDGTPGDPGIGNVNLIVNVYDKNNGNQPVDEATVTVIPPTGGQQTRLTSSSGAAIFVVPNLSAISVTATKSGYSSKSDSITTTIYGPDTLSLGLTRFVATPTPTVTNSLGTPVTTVIPGCEDPTSSTCYAARDTEMANDVRDWIEILIPIAGIMTIMYLLGWKP